jgi:hypothetical protein
MFLEPRGFERKDVNVTYEEISLKTYSLHRALVSIPAKEKMAQLPAGHFGREYNKLLELAKANQPEVSAAYWPPTIEIDTEREVTLARYPEIEAYLDVILQKFPQKSGQLHYARR